MIKYIWTNGCFDVLTYGHIKMFQYAKSLLPSGVLIVGVDSDKRVKERKGNDRPVHSLDQRIFNLKSIRYVDAVIPFENSTQLENTIKIITPDIFVIGDEYKDKKIIGREYAKEIKFFDMPRITSSSELIKTF